MVLKPQVLNDEVCGPFGASSPVSVVVPKPRGSKYAMFEVSGSENHSMNGLWYLKPHVANLDPLPNREHLAPSMLS